MSSYKETYTVPDKPKEIFLNRLAPVIFPYLASKAKAKKAISEGELLVNGCEVNWDYRVLPGDEISFSIKKASAPKKKIYQEKVPVVFEDEYLAVLNKPGGMPVNGNQFKTLENALPYNLKPSKEPDALPYPMPLHRLDAPTCGLVVVAKTHRAQVEVGKMFENKTIKKRYQAVVVGTVQEKKGIIDSPVDGKKSISEYDVVRVAKSAKYGSLTQVRLYPITGRTHQLRIHMAGLGHPIVGDPYYSGNIDVLKGKGLLLCSDQVSFKHPITGETVTATSKLPNKFSAYVDREDRRTSYAGKPDKKRR